MKKFLYICLVLAGLACSDHAVHFDFDHNGVADFFANMTTIDVPMHTGSSRRLHIKLNDVTYSVYDDTIVPNS